MYCYTMISKSEEDAVERRFVERAAETAAIKLQADDVPAFFIKEDVNGYIKYPFRINGYCSHDGKYIAIRRGLTPKSLVETTVHEMRHAYQCQNGKRHKLSVEMRERDAELFVREFWGSHSNSGNAATLMQTLEKIADEESDRLWKAACAFARARLSRPPGNPILTDRLGMKAAETESSDALRQRFAPIIRARSLAVQKFIDPSGRGLFPSDIEFGVPCAGLKLNYQK